jgi:hypothetical protein
VHGQKGYRLRRFRKEVTDMYMQRLQVMICNYRCTISVNVKMGVDIGTYRGRIGSFNHRLKLVVNDRDKSRVNFDCALKCIGSVVFVGLLLVLAGVEQNPGPFGKGDLFYAFI